MLEQKIHRTFISVDYAWISTYVHYIKCWKKFIYIQLFFFQSIKTIQKSGPYLLSGYSFGACVAMEITAQLEAAGETISQLTLLDGSHNFVSVYTGMYRDKKTIDSEAMSETEALLNFVYQFLPTRNSAEVKEKEHSSIYSIILKEAWSWFYKCSSKFKEHAKKNFFLDI